MGHDEEIHSVVVFDGTIFQAQMVKNLLENEDIPAYLKDEIIGTRSPLWTVGGGVKVVVSNLDYVKAKSIVIEFEKTFRET